MTKLEINERARNKCQAGFDAALDSQKLWATEHTITPSGKCLDAAKRQVEVWSYLLKLVETDNKL